MILSTLSFLIHQCTLHFFTTCNVGARWLAHCALTHLCQRKCLQATTSVGSSSSWDGPIYSAATFTATVSSQFKLDLKETATAKEIKRKPAQTAAVDLPPNKSRATANVSLLAHLQKLSTVTIKGFTGASLLFSLKSFCSHHFCFWLKKSAAEKSLIKSIKCYLLQTIVGINQNLKLKETKPGLKWLSVACSHSICGQKCDFRWILTYK